MTRVEAAPASATLPRIVAALGLAALGACSTRATGRPAPGGGPADARDVPVIRVAVANAGASIAGTAGIAWHAHGMTRLASSDGGERWALERERGGARVRAVRGGGGVATPWVPRLTATSGPGGFVTVNGARYRGRIAVEPLGDTLAVINHLSLEEYLPSVVGREMGSRPASDTSALQAQAVAARSYAVLRLGNRERPFDVFATVMDQAYGGVNAENPRAVAAVAATRGLVLRYDGRVVDAPYSSTCGGSTAEAQEVWRNRGAPYLQRVSDRIGGGDRYYCDIAPRFRWTQTLTAPVLNDALASYLARYAAVPSDGPGRARRLEIADRTASGRVGTLRVDTERGSYTLRGNEIRFVVRRPGGEILFSTYFSVHTEHGADGLVEQVTLRGQGYGHGIGMCQWGAIGRSRAGQSFRTILATYYPGTTLGAVQ